MNMIRLWRKKTRSTKQRKLEGFFEKINATADKLHGGSGPMPERPAYPFHLYKADVMTTIKQQNPTANAGEVSKLVREKWQTLTHEQKQQYEDAYEEKMKEYKERMKEYNELKNKYSNPPTPPGFLCCITMQMMTDPVIDPEGNTYERKAIETWLLNTPQSPVTRTPLSSHQLVPNRALCDSICEWKRSGQLKGTIPVAREDGSMERTNEQIRLYINAITGKTYVIDIDNTETIHSLVERLKEQHGVYGSPLRLILRNKLVFNASIIHPTPGVGVEDAKCTRIADVLKDKDTLHALLL